jgi:hypothetical protein
MSRELRLFALDGRDARAFCVREDSFWALCRADNRVHLDRDGACY